MGVMELERGFRRKCLEPLFLCTILLKMWACIMREYFLERNFYFLEKYSLQGTTQGRYLTGGVPPVRFSM